MLLKKLVFLSIFCTGLCVHSNAQYTLGLTGHRGYLVAHRPLVAGLRQSSVRGVDLSIAYQTNGSKDWHHTYGFPETGFYLGYWDMGNRDKLGSAFAVIPFIDFPMGSSRKSTLMIRFGWGAGFIEKKFDSEKNYKNTAIGSRINNAILLHPKYRFVCSPFWDISLGLSLTHYSNGSFETPNLGINMASFTLGISSKITKDSVPRPVRRIITPEKTAEWLLFGSVFAKEVTPADGDKYAAATIMAERMWHHAAKVSFGLGGDVFYDQSLIRRPDYNVEDGIGDQIRSGAHGTMSMEMGRTSLVLSMGTYLYSGITGESVYHRFGLRHRIAEKWLICMHVKSHWAKADFMEIGVARSWKKQTSGKQSP